LFVSEIEAALVAGSIDLAVHSCKDLPSAIASDCVLVAFPERADVRDVLVSRHNCKLSELPAGARIGTSSLRRACQLRALRPDVQIVDLRGNVDTRLRKAMTADYDAIVLAAAGLDRLGLSDRVTQVLEPVDMLPAVAQGALAIECRADAIDVHALVAPLDHGATRLAVTAERAFLQRLDGGCQVPIAAYATVEETAQTPAAVWVHGLVGNVNGTDIVRGDRRGTASDPARLGVDLAEDLLRRGAADILKQFSRVVSPVGVVGSP